MPPTLPPDPPSGQPPSSGADAPPEPAAPTRLGCVSYLNTLPLIEGLGKLRNVRLTLTAPARLIGLLEGGSVDAALVSTIDFQRSREPLTMIPAGMIGCDGPTLTVRLFSRTPIGEVRRVAADADSHTSIALVTILLRELTGEAPAIEPIDADALRAENQRRADRGEAPEWPESILLIGDKVVTDSPPAIAYEHQLDLGAAWKELTGLPFVYAVWMCRADRASEPGLLTAAGVLDRTRRHNATRLGWLAATRAPVRGWPADLARRYLGELLRYEVTPAARRAVDEFFSRAASAGLVERPRPCLWADDPPTG